MGHTKKILEFLKKKILNKPGRGRVSSGRRHRHRGARIHSLRAGRSRGRSVSLEVGHAAVEVSVAGASCKQKRNRIKV
jgi:hypothetical protein